MFIDVMKRPWAVPGFLDTKWQDSNVHTVRLTEIQGFHRANVKIRRNPDTVYS